MRKHRVYLSSGAVGYDKKATLKKSKIEIHQVGSYISGDLVELVEYEQKGERAIQNWAFEMWLSRV